MVAQRKKRQHDSQLDRVQAFINDVHHSEEYFRTVFEITSDALALSDPEGTVIAANMAYCQLYGYTAEEVIGHNFSVIFPEAFRSQAVEQYKQVFAGKIELPTYIADIKRKDGTTRIVESRTGFVEQGGKRIAMLSAIRDVTNQQKLIQDLHVRQSLTSALSQSYSVEEVAQTAIEQLVRIINATTSNFHLYHAEDNTFEMVYSNSQLPPERLSRWRRYSAVPGLPVTDVLRHHQPLWFSSARERELAYPSLAEFAHSHPGASALLPLVTKNGVIAVLSFTFTEQRVFTEAEQQFLVVLVSECALALERALLYEAEQKARLAAEEANETKMRFLAMISHELRTPLTSIKGFSSTLLAEDVTWDAKTQHDFIQIIDTEADQLQSLIDDLLDLSRLQSGTFKVEPRLLRVDEILAASAPHLAALTENHQLVIDCSPDMPALWVDKARFTQVMSNLVQNAAKYSPPQSRIDVKIKQNGQFIEFSVEDEGAGIAEDLREAVFEAFRQLKGGIKGVGLGLAICKGIIEAHEGKIWIGKKTSPGTVILVNLPIAEP